MNTITRRLSPTYLRWRLRRRPTQVAEERIHTVVLIRAGWTDYDDQHRLLGTLDMPVNDKGTEQIRTLVRQLQDADLRLQAVFSCPEDPAASTAAAIHESQPWARL
ncbi:MAG: histidine phosphatase family protein, partial [Planctomycetaceae bacterium]|nr:histidine phosphatase family protein [Planctomycetaceae bacterium]